VNAFRRKNGLENFAHASVSEHVSLCVSCAEEPNQPIRSESPPDEAGEPEQYAEPDGNPGDGEQPSLLGQRGDAHERDADAIRLYEEALESDSWRFDYQLKLARLLHKRGDSQAAAEKAAEVQRSARDPRLARQAAKLLASIKSAPAAESGEAGGSHGPARSVESHESANPASPAATIREADLAIVPFGQIDHDLIDGVRGDLERQLGIHVWLLPESLPLGNPERTRAALFDHDQYNAERLTAWLQERIPATRSPRVIGYLGITAADIYGEGTNFIFGTAAPGAGVMSYARFLSPTGGDAAGDPLVRQRTLKQAISTSFFILGIPRCSSATCVRSYPHSVYEHDRKGSELCAECRQRLDAAVQRALTSPSEL